MGKPPASPYRTARGATVDARLAWGAARPGGAAVPADRVADLQDACDAEHDGEEVKDLLEWPMRGAGGHLHIGIKEDDIVFQYKNDFISNWSIFSPS